MKRPGKGLALVGIILGMATAVACSDDAGDENTSSSSSGGGGGGGDAKGFFVSKVHKSVTDTCKECHGTSKRGAPVFLGASAEASYTAIEGFPGLIEAPSFSPLVQKGVHSGPALTQTQTDLLTQWLNLEVKQRKLGTDPGAPKNLRAAFKAFGACMDYDKWKALKLYSIAAMDTENNRGQCRSCHHSGEASLWLQGGELNQEQENAITFSKFQQFPYIQRLVVGRVKDDGTFESIEAARRLIDKGTEARQLQANTHPQFSLSSDMVAALTSYVLETISNVNANRCTGVTQPDAGLLDASNL